MQKRGMIQYPLAACILFAGLVPATTYNIIAWRRLRTSAPLVTTAVTCPSPVAILPPVLPRPTASPPTDTGSPAVPSAFPCSDVLYPGLEQLCQTDDLAQCIQETEQWEDWSNEQWTDRHEGNASYKDALEDPWLNNVLHTALTHYQQACQQGLPAACHLAYARVNYHRSSLREDTPQEKEANKALLQAQEETLNTLCERVEPSNNLCQNNGRTTQVALKKVFRVDEMEGALNAQKIGSDQYNNDPITAGTRAIPVEMFGTFSRERLTSAWATYQQACAAGSYESCDLLAKIHLSLNKQTTSVPAAPSPAPASTPTPAPEQPPAAAPESAPPTNTDAQEPAP